MAVLRRDAGHCVTVFRGLLGGSFETGCRVLC